MQRWLAALRRENGSVTAELAVTLPAVGLLLAIVVGVFALQVQHLALVGDAAMAARAVARGETQAVAEQLVAKAGRKLSFSKPGELVCAKLSQPAQLAGLPTFLMTEVSCARAAGF